MKKRSIIVLISLMMFGLLISCLGNNETISVQSNNQITDRFINVTAEGVSKARPDIATFTISIEELAETTEQALNNANKKIAQVYKALLKHGVEKTSTETSSLRISPRTKWENGQEIFKGQGVTQSIRVRLDIDSDNEDNKIGVIIDDLGLISGIMIGSIEFSIKDKEPLYKEAREKAVKTALEKTNDFAKGAGIKTGKILSITEGSLTGVYERNFAKVATMAADESYMGTSITSGDIEVKVTVNVVTEIKE